MRMCVREREGESRQIKVVVSINSSRSSGEIKHYYQRV